MRFRGCATSTSRPILPDDILTKVDRASMAASLETRAPCLDHRLVEWSFRLPPRSIFATAKGSGSSARSSEKRLPTALFDRPKTGFGLPIGEWLRGPLREWAEEVLDERRLRATGLIDPARCARSGIGISPGGITANICCGRC